MLKKLAPVSIIVLLSACDSQEDAVVLGAVLGAAVGGVVAGEDNRALGIILGGAVGAALGNEFGKTFGKEDKQRHANAAKVAVARGSSQSWSNPETGAAGEIIPLRHSAGKPNCTIIGSREYINGRLTHQSEHEACLNEYGEIA